LEIFGDYDDIYTVNGGFQPQTAIPTTNDVFVYRLINAGAFMTLELRPDYPDGECEMRLLSRDGMFHQQPLLQIRTVVLVSGSRAAVAIKCKSSMQGKLISWNVDQDPSRDWLLGSSVNGNRFRAHKLIFTTMVGNKDGDTNGEFPTSATPYPRYMTDLTSKDPAVDKNVHIGDEFGTKEVIFSSFMYVNDKAFHLDQPLLKLCKGDAYEILISSTNVKNTRLNPHIYHHHIHPFQIQNNLDPTGEVFRKGEWRDVAAAVQTEDNEKKPRIRWWLYDFSGPQVMHCHVLPHEDMGMMTTYNVKDCSKGDRTDPDFWKHFDFPYSGYVPNIYKIGEDPVSTFGTQTQDQVLAGLEAGGKTATSGH
jgi:FtsP/CotA-like multicopper oxidase with cupredoxin domain